MERTFEACLFGAFRLLFGAFQAQSFRFKVTYGVGEESNMAETEALRRQCEYVTVYLGGPESFDDWRRRMSRDHTLSPGGHEILEAASIVLGSIVEDHAERRGEKPTDVWSRWMLKLAAEQER